MSKPLKRLTFTVFFSLTLYVLLGFLILPGVALHVINDQLAKYAAVPARIERLELNPFTLELNARGFSLGPDGKPEAALHRLYVDLEWDSLWSGALHFAQISLEHPQVRLDIGRDGQLNALGWFKLPSQQPATEDASSEGLFPLRVDHIELSRGQVRFRDARPDKAVKLTYDDLSVTLERLSTLPDSEGNLRLDAHTPDGARLAWNGQLGLSPLQSNGEIEVSNLSLATLFPYVRQFVPLALTGGRLDLGSQYRFKLADKPQLALNKAHLKLADFGLDAVSGEPLLRLQQLDVGDTSVDLADRRVRIGKVHSQKLESWVERRTDGQLNWLALLPANPADEAAVETAPPAAAEPWHIELIDAQLNAQQIHLSDRVPDEAVALEIGPLDARLQHFDSSSDKPFALELDTRVGLHGNLKASGEVALSPMAARLELATKDLDLRSAQAYLTPYVHLELRSAMLDSALAVELAGVEPLALSVTGQASITQLHVRDSVKNRDLLRWRTLDVSGLNYRHGDSLVIDKVKVSEPYGRFIIYSDLSTNVGDLVVQQPAATQPQPAKPAPAEPPLDIRIRSVELVNGSAHFADLSLQPNFATDIQTLNGRITAIDNRSRQPATVNISGKVDRYAPVSIDGTLTPFDPMQSLDIAAKFMHLELTTLTPYAAKFAGYRIRKGRLSLGLQYSIQRGQLTADHSVKIEELQLGEQVDSPNAVDLPVRLAVALLKDSNGIIQLDLPVTGDLTNPQFNVMPVVWKTLRNLVVKAAAAPFKFIGGLIGSEDTDLGQVRFSAGSAELSDEARSSLHNLSLALAERPQLRLEIEAAAARSLDGPSLAEARLERAYREAWYRKLQAKGERLHVSAEELQVPEDEKADLLEGIYRQRLKAAPPADWSRSERDRKMRQALIASWANSDLLLRQLGQQRAAAIKDYLVDEGKLEDQRVFLLDTQLLESSDESAVITQLHLGGA